MLLKTEGTGALPVGVGCRILGGGGYCEDNLFKAEDRHQAERPGSAATFTDAIQCTFHLQGNLSELAIYPEDCSSSAQPQISLWSGEFYHPIYGKGGGHTSLALESYIHRHLVGHREGLTCEDMS